MEYDHGYKLYKKFYRNIHCNRAEFDEQNVDHNYNYGMLNAVFIIYILARNRKVKCFATTNYNNLNCMIITDSTVYNACERLRTENRQ